MTGHTSAWRAGLVTALASVLPLSLAACQPNDNGPSTPPTQAAPAPKGSPTDCAYNIYDDLCNASPSPSSFSPPAAVPKGSMLPTPAVSATRWGDYKFGDCSVSLYPPTIGLSLDSSRLMPVIGMQVGTACVGYQPQKLDLTIHLERWTIEYPAGSTSKTPVPPPKWHEVLTNNFPVVEKAPPGPLPPLAVLGPDGEVPWAEQHQITREVGCVHASVTGEPSLYHLVITMTGVSYSGEPIVGGGTTAALVIPWSQCI